MAVTAELVSVVVTGNSVACRMQNVYLAGFEVSTAVLLRFQILWYLHGSRIQRGILLNPVTLKMKVVRSFRVSVNTNAVAQCHIVEETNVRLPSVFGYSFYKHVCAFSMMSLYLSILVVFLLISVLV
jgi:hypothetical protein